MRRLIHGLTCALSLLPEVFFLVLVLQNRPVVFLLSLFLHAGACLLFAYSMAKFFPSGQGWGKITLFCAFFLSLYGFCGMLFILLLTRIRKQEARVFHLDIGEDDDTEEEPGDIRLPEAEILEVESFADILIGEDKELRLGAIDALQELKDRNAISLLAASLDSTFHEVRYYAVEALNKIAQEYLDKINVLQQMVEIKPDDRLIRRTLADIYFDYAFKGIEELSIQEYYYRLAAKEYRTLLEDKKEEAELLMNLTETEYRLRNYEVCSRLLEQLPAEAAADNRALELKAECLLKTRDFGKLHSLCAELVRNSAVPVEIRQAAEMWLQDG